MNLLLSVIVLCATVLSCTKSVSCSDDTTISIGKILDNWVYENEDLNIRFKFPQDWNYLWGNKMMHLVSTNDRVPYQDTLNITLKDLKNNENRYVIFSLFDNDFSQDYTGGKNIKKIVFIIEPSKNQNAKKDMQEWVKIFEEQTKNIPKELKQQHGLKETTLPFGKNEKLPAFDAMGRITGFKNYGCYNLVISVDCFSDVDKSVIFDILETIKSE